MLSVLLLIIAVWAIIASRVPEYILPSPEAILRELVTNKSLYLRHTFPTAVEAGLGFAVGTAVAILAAMSFLYFRALRESLYPLAVALNSVPIVAVAPLLIISFGNGLFTKVLITALISYFPTLVGMTKGLLSVETEAVEYFRAMGAGSFRTLALLRWPASLLNLFVALRIAASATVISAVIAEWVGANQGLGYLIILSSRQFQILQMWTSVVAATLLALLAFGVVVLVERRVLAGRPVS